MKKGPSRVPCGYSTGEWEFPKQECLTLLSIGQMIELLYEKQGMVFLYYMENSQYNGNKRRSYPVSEVGKDIHHYDCCGSDFEKEELCDALFEAVKVALK